MVIWMHVGGEHLVIREGLLLSHRSARVGLAASLSVVLLAPLGLATVSAAAAGATTSASLVRVRDTAIHASTASTNWSGYGVTGTFSAITGSWTVPTAAPSAGPTYSSSWIGIDGLANQKLIQVGTESDYVGGHARYDAWWEVLPAAEKVIAKLPVAPGDHLSASITHGVAKHWTIVLTDTTSGKKFTYTRGYRGPAVSAEWIQERPMVGGNLATLANYGTTTFSALTANGVNPHLSAAEAISMVGGVGDRLISVPSMPSTPGNSFTVAYGDSTPPPPGGFPPQAS
jgi:Peptidase A4 family